MPVTGYDTASRDLGRRSMMAMKEGTVGGGSGIPPEAFGALTERVRLVEDRVQMTPTKAELNRAVTRAIAVGAILGAAIGAALAVVVTRLIA